MPYHVKAYDHEIQMFRNDIFFGSHSSSHAIFSFVEKQILDQTLWPINFYIEYNIKEYYIEDEYLELLFSSSVLVEWFWEFLSDKFYSQYSDLLKQLQKDERADIKQIKQLLAEVMPKSTTHVEKFKMLKFLTVDIAFENAIKVFLEIVDDKNSEEFKNETEVLKWIVCQIDKEFYEFEKKKLKYEQNIRYINSIKQKKQHACEMARRLACKYSNQKLYYVELQQNIENQVKKLIDAVLSLRSKQFEIFSLQRRSIMLEPKFILNLLFYISKKVTNKISSLFISTDDYNSYIFLFYRAASVLVLPLKKIQTYLAEKLRVKLRQKLLNMMDILGFDELKINDEQDQQNIYKKTLKMLKNGMGFYCLRHSNSKCFVWIHIGSKTSKRFAKYGNTFAELFFKTLGNIFYLFYGTKQINITLMDAQDEAKINLSTTKVIEFSKNASWSFKKFGSIDTSLSFPIFGGIGIAFGQIDCKSSVLLKEDSKKDFNSLSLLDTPKYGDIITLGLFWKQTCLNEEIGVGALLPPGKYVKGYNFCCGNSDIRAQALEEMTDLQADTIEVNFTVLENHLKTTFPSKWQHKLEKQVREIIDMLIIQIETDEFLQNIIIYTEINIQLERLFDAKPKKGTYGINIRCSCRDERNCINKIECESDLVKGKFTFINHMYNQ